MRNAYVSGERAVLLVIGRVKRVLGSPSSPFLSAYPVRYDDGADQLLDFDSLLVRDTVEFGIDLLSECLHVLDSRHSMVQ